MSAFQNLAERIRRGDPVPLPLAALLSAATPVQRLGMFLRLRKPRTRVEARVISFGNITAGGTGKTPAVIERARIEIAAGHRVAVLTRGYGTAASQEPLLVASTEDASFIEMAKRVGDEPALIVRRAPGVAVVKCADRVAGARKALREGYDTLILDDGFQCVQLERDENVLVIDAAHPFGNGRLIPRGILREPLHHMARATHIVLTRCDQARGLPALLETVARFCPGVPVRQTRHAPQRLWRLCDNVEAPLAALKNRTVKAACGIGNPEAFYRTIESLGAIIGARAAYRDHASIPMDALAGVEWTVTTEKDAMRIAH
ncbi:MAG: Tetraacyldisaccharide 4-kinase, partial [Candidatus Hydrogenedentes bacterium]|nr:Tetraacyldisaccharide 4-kinase [Candidatus Hydrogenedentota bacterium]